jgi:hypothetical protein
LFGVERLSAPKPEPVRLFEPEGGVNFCQPERFDETEEDEFKL